MGVTPAYVYFDGVRCRVVDWRETMVAFEHDGGIKWRCKSAVKQD